MKTNQSNTDQKRAMESFRDLKPGDTVFTILREVSRTGMSAKISVLLSDGADQDRLYFTYPHWAASRITPYNLANSNGHTCLRVNGCGFNRGEAIVDAISYSLFGKQGQLKHVSL